MNRISCVYLINLLIKRALWNTSHELSEQEIRVKLIIFGNKYLFWVAKLRRRDVLLKEYLSMARATIHYNRSTLSVWKCVHVKEMLNAGLFWDKARSSKVMKRPNPNSLCCYCCRHNKEITNATVVLCRTIHFLLMRHSNDGHSLLFNKAISDFIAFSTNYINLAICVW